VLGVKLERSRLLILAVAALLAAFSVVAVGVIGFVGLVAPHAARALVGGRHARVVPVAVLLGAVLVGLADAVGRTVIAPAQLPPGSWSRSSALRTSCGCSGAPATCEAGVAPGSLSEDGEADRDETR
jgi:ABC-type Fe3+-siderophore transport system permease subunit